MKQKLDVEQSKMIMVVLSEVRKCPIFSKMAHSPDLVTLMRWSKLIASGCVFDADSSEKFPTKLKMEWIEDSGFFMLRTEQESLTVN